VDTREIPIDCLTPESKTRWFKYTDAILKVYKLQKNNSMFSEIQTVLAERVLSIVRIGGTFFANNSEFLKRLVNPQSKTEWNEAVTPLLDVMFTLVIDGTACARDGTMGSIENLIVAVGPLEKLMGSIVSRWSRLNDKGHGPEVDKMGPNLENFESAIHRLENSLVKHVSDTKQGEIDRLANIEKQKQLMEAKKIENAKLMKEREIAMQQQMKENNEYMLQQERENQKKKDDPFGLDLSFGGNVKRQMDQYGGLDDKDPNSAILKSLMDLNNL